MKIRKLFFLLATIFGFLLLSCQEEYDPPQIFPPVEGGDWQIFQLAKIYVEDIPEDDKSFSGSIKGVPISIGRIPGDTIVFIIPNVGEGSADLTINMGNQIRRYTMELDYWPYYEDQQIFFTDLLQKCAELQENIRNSEKLKELEEPFGQWIEFFTQKLGGLSTSEREYLSGTLENGKTGMRASNRLEMECINTPRFTLGSFTYKFVRFDYSHLNDFIFLPSNEFHDAVLGGLGLTIWYNKVLLEYYAYQILECPQIRAFELIDSETAEVISPLETLRLESNQLATFGHNGIFKTLTVEDLREGAPFYSHSIGFQERVKIFNFFSEIVEKYTEAYSWELPLLDPNSLIFPPDDAPTIKGPIQQMEWYYYTNSLIDNPNIRLVSFDSDEEAFSIKLESLDGKSQPFNLSISVRTKSRSFDAVIPSLLEVTCPILMDMTLMEGTHTLDISYGNLPYTISWSNGANGEMSQNLSPGNYEVNVTDAEGCERTIQFTVPEFGILADIDGNTYKTVKVGTTWWMAENLRTTRKRDGTAILHLPSNEEWIKGNQPAFSWLNNDQQFDESFGKLYNYHAACCDICPTGWKLPGISELSEISGVFGMNSAGSLRALNAWPDGSLKSTNLSGLSFLPAGFRVGRDGAFPMGKPFATFWIDYKDPYGLPHLVIIQGSVDFYSTSITTSGRDGYSVRCVKE